jgi:acetyltransferase-like isoleucine patch superfamily enzyme
MNALAQVLGPVVGLETATILGPCVLGHPAADAEVPPLVLEPGVVIRAYAVLYQGSTIGADVAIGHGALVRERNVVGPGTSIGSGAQLEPGNEIGARCRIHSGCFLASSRLGDDVFLGPNVVTADDPHPPCPRYAECRGGAVLGDGAAVGANVTLLPGVVLGARCLVAAGAVVTHDVEAGWVVAGVPAAAVGRRDELPCPVGHFGHAYEWDADHR